MKEIILNKQKELFEEYDFWLRRYDEEGQEHQERAIERIRNQLAIIYEIIRESEKSER